MLKFITAYIFVLIFSGCTSISNAERSRHYNKLKELGGTNRCDEAINLINSSTLYEEDDEFFKLKMMDIGIIHYFCYKDKKKGIDFFTLSARYGYKEAIQFLASIGIAAPTADLANTSKAQGEAGWADIIGAGVKATQKGK